MGDLQGLKTLPDSRGWPGFGSRLSSDTLGGEPTPATCFGRRQLCGAQNPVISFPGSQGRPPGLPSLLAQTPGFLLLRFLVLPEGTGQACTGRSGLPTELSPLKFGSRCTGWGSCFSGEGVGNVGFLRAPSPLFQPHSAFLSIFRSLLCPFLSIRNDA